MSNASRRSASIVNQIDAYLKSSRKPKPLQLIYSTQANWPLRPIEASSSRNQIDIGVLDSSFNPPQLAHYALSNSAKPPFPKTLSSKDEPAKPHYDALLLIYSVRNADKGTGTKKDASPTDRLQLMQEFAKDIEEKIDVNVAVAIVEEPLMIAKSTLIHEFIKENQPCSFRLHWLVGFDTLERFFQVKYYPSPDFFHQACDTYFNKERTTFVCARRGLDSLPNKQGDEKDQEKEERDLLVSEEVKPWVEQGVVQMMDLEKSVQSVSSTAIRKVITDGALDEDILQARLQEMTTKRVAQYLVEEAVYSKE